MLKHRHSSFTLPNTADTDIQDSASKRNKDSLMKLVASSELGEDMDVDIKIRMPCLVKGKSNQLLNNTLYLKKLSSVNT